MIGIRVFIVFEEWCQYISKHLERYGNHILFGTIPILSDCRIRGSRNSRYASSGKKKKSCAMPKIIEVRSLLHTQQEISTEPQKDEGLSRPWSIQVVLCPSSDLIDAVMVWNIPKSGKIALILVLQHLWKASCYKLTPPHVLSNI